MFNCFSNTKRTLMGVVFFLLASVATADNGTIRINPAARQQTMEGWGVSLCWWANMCGKWSDDKVDDLVDMLTSPDKLNFNIFRYNIGGGDRPDHYDGHMCRGKGKRAEMEGFKATENSNYNWNADAAQRKVLLKLRDARKNDVVFEAFSNSAPYWMTYSGCASGNTNAGKDNLKPEYYGKFADYLIDVCKHYKEKYGIEFKTLAPFNEPNTNFWGQNGTQEGCHFDPASQVNFLRVIYPKLKASGLKTVLSASDETNVPTAIGELSLFRKEGDIIPMLGQYNVHTYGGDVVSKVNLKDMVSETKLPFWMSETGSGGTGIGGNLNMAQRMFEDLNYLQPQAWIDWQFVEELNDQWCMVRGSFANQTYYKVKNFYVRMQVTRFIKQGYTLLSTGRNDILAAISPSGDEVVVVMLNTGEAEKEMVIDLSLLNHTDAAAKLYVTNSQLDCQRKNDVDVVDGILSYRMGGLEIATFVIGTDAGDGIKNFTDGVPYLFVPRAATTPIKLNNGGLQLATLSVADTMQYWYIGKLANGNYNIYTLIDGKKMALTDDGTYYLSAKPLNSASAGQQFAIEDLGDNCFKVISSQNGKLFDLEGGKLDAGTKVGLWKASDAGSNSHREWRILSVPFTNKPKESVTETQTTVAAENPIFVTNGRVVLLDWESVASDYSVSQVNGTLVASGRTSGILTEIPLSNGIYVVRWGNQSKKLVVR